jgi:hypothetical protein
MSLRLALAALLALAGFVAGAVFLWPRGRDAACVRPGRLSGEAVRRLAGYAGKIEHGVEHSHDGGHEEWWVDSNTGNRRQLTYDVRGKLTGEFATAYTGTIERTAWIFYTDGTFQTDVRRVGAGRNPNPALADAQANLARVAGHQAAVVGRDALGVHLREIRHMPMPKGTFSAAIRRQIARTRTVHIDTWVDPVTYLTVREAFRDGSGSTVIDEHWLSRTPANVARTRLVIPRGFSRIYARATETELTLSSRC